MKRSKTHWTVVSPAGIEVHNITSESEARKEAAWLKKTFNTEPQIIAPSGGKVERRVGRPRKR